jgi:hypothetical protein
MHVMKRLVVAISLTALLLTSTGCGLRGLCLRGGPCRLRRPLTNPFSRVIPGRAPAAVATPAPVCPPYETSYEPACGNVMYAPADAPGAIYDYGTTGAPIIESVPIESAPIEGVPLQSVPGNTGFNQAPLGTQRPVIIYSDANDSIPRPPTPGLIQGPEMGTIPN